MSDTRVHVQVHGRVQGVFFRATVREEAERHGVTGWVRNRDDGSVEAEFQGPREAVDAMVQACREGSDQARVQDLDVTEVEPEPDAQGFTVQ